MIRFAVFDLDGTLVDSSRDLCVSMNHALRSVGLPERTLSEIAGFVGEGAARLVERAVAPALDRFEPALKAWWEHYEEHLLDNTTLYPGVERLLADLPWPAAVLTNKPSAMARRLLAGLSVLDRFVEVVGGGDVPRKPDPTGTRAILSRQQVLPTDAVLVGDSLVDLETARAVPLRFVAVGWGLVPPDRLRAAGAPSVATSIDELRRALGMPV